jgi:hypothetical protein
MLPLRKNDIIERMKASEAEAWKVKRWEKIGGLHKHVGSCGSDGLTKISLSRGDGSRPTPCRNDPGNCPVYLAVTTLSRIIRLVRFSAHCYRLAALPLGGKT